MKICFFLSSKNILPPAKTGGIEQPAYYLIKELKKRGHEITLYAAKGSSVKGVKVRNISPYDPKKIKLDYVNYENQTTRFYDISALVDFFRLRMDNNFDIIYYCNYIFFEILPFAKATKKPILIQINYPHDKIYPHIKDSILKIKNVNYVAMSNYVKKLMPSLSYAGTVYPVFDMNDFEYSSKKREYLFFIGRICPAKGVHLAIQIALQAGKNLIIAGRLDEEYKDYFNNKIKKYIDNKKIKFIGEIDFKAKNKIYGKAIATLFTSQWNEPFGIVQIESMAAGTPVLSFDQSAAREIIKNGVNGYIVRNGDIDAMAKAVFKADKLDKNKIRKYVENKFSMEKEADKFEKICYKMIKNNKKINEI